MVHTQEKETSAPWKLDASNGIAGNWQGEPGLPPLFKKIIIIGGKNERSV